VTKIAIVGASGFIGRACRDNFPTDTICLVRDPKHFQDVRFEFGTSSLLDVAGIETCTHVLILAANREPAECEQLPEKTWWTNVAAPISLIREALRCGLVPVFASTEMVYGPGTKPSLETAEISPKSVYGRQKAQVETFLKSNANSSLVMRIAKTVGHTPQDKSLFTNWIQDFRNGSDVLRCADDQFMTPIYVHDLAKSIWQLCAFGCSGIFNMGGKQRFTREELLRVLIDKSNLNGISTPNVEICSFREFPSSLWLDNDYSMDSERLWQSTGLLHTTMEEVVALCLDSAVRDGSHS